MIRYRAIMFLWWLYAKKKSGAKFTGVSTYLDLTSALSPSPQQILTLQCLNKQKVSKHKIIHLNLSIVRKTSIDFWVGSPVTCNYALAQTKVWLTISMFNQVAEVLSSTETRLSVSGWFHGPPAPRPEPYREPQLPMKPPLPLDVSVYQFHILELMQWTTNNS